MDKSIFQYIWRNSKGQQLTIMAMTACSFPFLLMALKLPKTIINDAIDGKDFPKDLFDLGLGLGQIEYLLVLCAALFFLIVINIAFLAVVGVLLTKAGCDEGRCSSRRLLDLGPDVTFDVLNLAPPVWDPASAAARALQTQTDPKKVPYKGLRVGTEEELVEQALLGMP